MRLPLVMPYPIREQEEEKEEGGGEGEERPLKNETTPENCRSAKSLRDLTTITQFVTTQ